MRLDQVIVETRCRFLLEWIGFLAIWLCPALISPGEGLAQSPPITPSGLNTQISAPTTLPSGQVNYNITGGTRPGNGPNLFHSFGLFNVPTNNIANFFNETCLSTCLPTTNILSRVTGGNPSNIFGTIRTTDFGNANLFLINPAGVLFGPTASLDIGAATTGPRGSGSFHVSTADYVRMFDGANSAYFYANPASDGLANSVLSSAPPVGFGFLTPAAFGFTSNSPAAIAIQGSTLSVDPGQSISVVGGDITMTGGTLRATGGQINLASVASPGEILIPNLQPAALPGEAALPTLGSITLSQGSTLDVSGNAAGTVIIRGGQLMIADATISADTINSNGAPVAVDINVSGDVSISDTRGAPAITAKTTGTGDAGEVRIAGGNLNASTTATSQFALIDTHTSGSGSGGNVSIMVTGNLNVTGKPTGALFFIDSGDIGLDGGHGGDVTIAGRDVKLMHVSINTGDLIARQLFQEAAGSGGNVAITADTLTLNNSTISTSGFGDQAGGITISGHDIQMIAFSGLEQIGINGTGRLTINADRLTMDSSQIDMETALGPGGGVFITAKSVELNNGSTVRSQTAGDGDAGGIQINASDHLTLSDDPTTLGARTRPTGLFTDSLGDPDLGTHGNAGTIMITTPQLAISGGARIDSTTETNGHGGDVTIIANSISMTGQRFTRVIEIDFFGIGSSLPSGIFTRTVGSDLCAGPCGDAGRVTINTGSLTIGGGAQINSGTTSTGRGGDVTINATGPVTLSGRLSDGTPSGIFSQTVDPATGVGGNINLQGKQISITDGASVSAQSTGTGPAGSISIGKDAPVEALVMQSSSITTESTQAGGGSIEIHAARLVQLTDSSITTSVHGGGGDAGNITIDPQAVVLQNSQILAQAFGGNGGNILIVADVFFADPTSTVSASSTLGINGMVSIQAPVTELSGTLAPLPAEIVQAAALLQARCAVRFAGGTASSFVVAGRDGLPLEPGGLLPSPLYAESPGSTRLAAVLDVPGLRVGRTFLESNFTLAPLAIGCSS